MKKLFILILILLCSCHSSEQSEENKESGKIKILSTTAMIDDLVKEIGLDKVIHHALITGEIDPHNYELVKGDEEKLSEADLIFYNGLGLEHGASLRYRLEHEDKARNLGGAFYKKDPSRFLFIQGQLDPHIWMDVSMWKEVAFEIRDQLVKQDPENENFYTMNMKRLQEKMEALDCQTYQTLHEVPQEKRYLVTSHDAFNYFARRYLTEKGENDWEKRFTAPEGLAPDGQLTAKDIRRIVNHLISYQIHFVFPESNVSRHALKKIVSSSADLGFKVELVKEELYADAIGPKHSAAEDYFKMIEYDAHLIAHYLLKWREPS